MPLARQPIAIIYEPRERFPSYSNVYPCISRLFKSAKKRIGNSCPPGLNGALPFGCKTFISGIYIVVVNTPESSTGKKLQRRFSFRHKKSPQTGTIFQELLISVWICKQNCRIRRSFRLIKHPQRLDFELH